MAVEEGYGDEGYTVAGRDRYTTTKLGRRFFPLAFIIGGTIGAVTALLVTPYPGERMREKVKDISEEMKERAEAYCAGAKETVSAAAELGKEMIQESKPLVRRAVEAGKEAYEREREKSKHLSQEDGK